MAYVAITRLMRSIHQSMELTGCDLQALYEKLESLRAILEKSCNMEGDLETLTDLTAEITQVAYTTEGMVDLESRNVFLAQNVEERIRAMWELFFFLEQALECIDSVMKQWLATWGRCNNMKAQKAQNISLVNVPELAVERPENTMVGHDNEFEMMLDQLTRGERELEVVSIVGMGGIGKTTMATKLYCDPRIMSQFDIRAKCTISQEHCVRNVLLGLLSTTSDEPDDQLADRLQKLLKRKRYLVVIDDIWTTEAWDDIRRCFPDCNNGSRILLTTRNVEVAEYASSGKPPYHMRLMNFDESWCLLYEKIFVNECFPPVFEQLGKQIALKCGGLPLTITVIAGLLSNIGKTLNEWESVAENISSVVSTDLESQCMGVLALSYHYLPHHLKPCFLHFARFREDKVINVEKLEQLWASEGFLKLEETKSIEEVAEKCLKDLMDRSLISIHLNFEGKIESCGMHDLTRELCLREARNLPVLPVKLRRVLDYNSMGSITFPSEILYKIHLRYLGLHLCPRLEQYLGSEGKVPSSIIDIPPSISSLCHLQNLILFFPHYLRKTYPLILPSEILMLPHLRQLHLSWNYLRNHEPTEKSLVLKNLQYLSGWNPRYCTGSFFRLFPNLKRLQIGGAPEDFCSRKGLYDFGYLDQLEECEFLRISKNYACFLKRYTSSGSTLRFQKKEWPCPADDVPRLLLPPPHAFPQNLKKLALTGPFLLPWKDLSIVGKLPKLESLKLSLEACATEECEVVEEGFPLLKFLLLRRLGIRYWRASSDHFPCLERLFLNNCSNLDSIPQDFAHINTLSLIDIKFCPKSVEDSAKQIQQDIQDNYGGSIEVHIHDTP